MPCLHPALMVALTHLVPAGRTFTSGDPAGAAAEDRVLGVEDQYLVAELGPDDAHQLLAQTQPGGPCLGRRGRALRVHSRTSVPVNQPACSSTRRASSDVRCP